MTAAGALEWVTNAAFVLASLGALRLWLRHRSPATIWLLATFAAIDVVLLVSAVVGETTGLVQRLVVVVLLAVPFCLFRFADAIVPARRAWRLGTQGLYALVVGLTLLLPELDAENAMESGDPLLMGWLFLALLLWFAPELAAGWLLARASVGEPGVVRSRLRVLAVACVGLGAYIPITSFVDDSSTAFDIGSQLVLITLGLLFVVGFAPPDVLRSAWREGDERRLYEAAVGLMGASHPDDVAAVVVPGARALMGAPRVVMRGPDGHVMARTGRAEADVRAGREVRTHAIGDATLELTVAPTMPVFGTDETQHLDRLALLAELALDRVRLLEAERTARANVERLNAELESFVYTTSHDLKNPLIAMLGYLDVIAEEHGPAMGSDMQHILDRMQVNARHMDALIRDLLELSRVGRVNVTPERVDLAALVDDLGRDLSSRHPQARVVRGSLPVVMMNQTRARQLLTNLFDNAVAYGGRPDVTIRVESVPHVDGGTRVVVRDDGQGIGPDHLERVFGVFERLDPDHTTGTGMGLAICRRVVEHLGGSMQAVPSSDGAVFHIDLPAAAILAEDPTTAVSLEGSAP